MAIFYWTNMTHFPLKCINRQWKENESMTVHYFSFVIEIPSNCLNFRSGRGRSKVTATIAFAFIVRSSPLTRCSCRVGARCFCCIFCLNCWKSRCSTVQIGTVIGFIFLLLIGGYCVPLHRSMFLQYAPFYADLIWCEHHFCHRYTLSIAAFLWNQPKKNRNESNPKYPF